MRWLILLLVIDVLAVGLLLFGEGETREPGRLIFAASSDHNFLDPQRLSASNDIRMAENLFETLLRHKLPSLDLEPAAAAEMPQVSDDSLTYTFQIRKDAKWSNGDPLTAHDFKYAWRRGLLPDYASDYTYLFFHIKGAKQFFEWRADQTAAYQLESARQTLDDLPGKLSDYSDAVVKHSAAIAVAKDREAGDPPKFDKAAAIESLESILRQLEHHRPYDEAGQLERARTDIGNAIARLDSLTDENAGSVAKQVRQATSSAHAVLDSYMANTFRPSPEMAHEWLTKAYEHFDETVGVKVVDDHTIGITLGQPTAYFIYLTGFITYAPVHEKSVEQMVSLDADTAMLIQDPRWTHESNIVCNGAYTVARRRFKRDLLLVANEHYWNRANMKNDSILELIIPDYQTQLLLYETGHIHWTPDIPSSTSMAQDLLQQSKAGRRNDIHAITAVGTYYYNFNCIDDTFPNGQPNVFKDPRVRRAFSMAVDRKTLVDKVTRAGQEPAYSFVPPGTNPSYEPPFDAGLKYDPEAARALLAEAGYPGGKGIEGLVILYNTGANHELSAQAVARMWKQELGVGVDLEGKEWPVFQEDRKEHKFSVSRGGWIGDYPDPTTFLELFASDSGHNDAGYKNPAFDEKMAEAAKETDPAKRMELMRQAERIVLDDQPVIPLYYYNWFHVFDPDKVKNMHLNAWNNYRLEFVEVVGE